MAVQPDPLHRHVASPLPPPEQTPDELASVNTYTDPVAGADGGLANVALGKIQLAP
jgi:hypothetical protein